MGKASREKNKRREWQDLIRPFEATHNAARAELVKRGFVPKYPNPAIPSLTGLFVAAMEEVIAAGLRIIGEKPSPESLVQFAEATTVIHDRYAELALFMYRERNPMPVACKAGCNWCCHVRVSIGLDEAYRLKKTLDTMEPERRQRILDRIDQHVAETDSMDAQTVARKPRLCPMNEDGNCQVYETRAVMCRNHMSYDVNPCRSFVEGNAEGMNTVNGYLQEFGRYVTLGSLQVLEFYGIDSRAFELADALKAMWEKPDTIDAIVAGDRAVSDALFRSEVEASHNDFITGVMRKSQIK